MDSTFLRNSIPSVEKGERQLVSEDLLRAEILQEGVSPENV